MARTEPRKPQDHLTAEKTAAAERSARHRVGHGSSTHAPALSPSARRRSPHLRISLRRTTASMDSADTEVSARPAPRALLDLRVARACRPRPAAPRRRLLRDGGGWLLAATRACMDARAAAAVETLANSSPPLSLFLALRLFSYLLESVYAAGRRSMHIPKGNARLQAASGISDFGPPAPSLLWCGLSFPAGSAPPTCKM